MSIRLTPSQEQFIQSKLQSGKYRSAEELLETALRLLDENDHRAAALTQWEHDSSHASKELARSNFERHFGAIDLDIPYDVTNESIDADLANEYASTHAADYRNGESV